MARPQPGTVHLPSITQTTKDIFARLRLNRCIRFRMQAPRRKAGVFYRRIPLVLSDKKYRHE